MASLGNVRKNIADQLALINLTYREAEIEAQFIMQYVLEQSSAYLILNQHQKISKYSVKQITNIVSKRKKGIPLAYIIKEWDFYGHTFLVTKDTLIPRQDTELLIDIILKKYKKDLSLNILDLGAGSGIIGITLARNFKKSEILMTDLSVNAIKVAKKNIDASGLKNIKCLQSNWFEKIDYSMFDIIVSNPPYIPKNDPHLESPELKYQPQMALTADDDGFSDIDNITFHAQKFLKKSGILLIEHGYNQARKVQEIFNRNKLSGITQFTDINNTIRATLGSKI